MRGGLCCPLGAPGVLKRCCTSAGVGRPQRHPVPLPHIPWRGLGCPGAPGDSSFQPGFGLVGNSPPSGTALQTSSSVALWCFPGILMNAWVSVEQLLLEGFVLSIVCPKDSLWRETNSLVGSFCILCVPRMEGFGDLPSPVPWASRPHLGELLPCSLPLGSGIFPDPDLTPAYCCLPSVLFYPQPCFSPGFTSHPISAQSSPGLKLPSFQ